MWQFMTKAGGMAVLFAAAGVAWAGDDKAKPATILETASAAGQFKTLLTAVRAAGLEETLNGSGPFTVFAPTDEAFAKLPKGTLDGLLKDPQGLAAVLKLHVVPGRVMAADVVKMTSAKTALGQTLTIDAKSGVKVNGVAVAKTDIVASNGVIHVVDAVLLPSNDIIEVARGARSFKTLLAALDAAGLTDALRGDGPFTVFAPTDEAFAKLPAGTLEGLLKDKAKLTGVLTFHVVPGKMGSAEVAKAKELKTLQGQSLTVDTTSGVKVSGATVVKPDVPATNGVIHVIDTVVVPN